MDIRGDPDLPKRKLNLNKTSDLVDGNGLQKNFSKLTSGGRDLKSNKMDEDVDLERKEL